MIKRVLDLTIALVGSVLGAPCIAVLALAIRIESPGHPIYLQTRVGRHGTPFSIYKLRTMVRAPNSRARPRHPGGRRPDHADRRVAAPVFARRAAEPVERAAGEMSIVGPRPTVPVQVEQYTERQRGRLAVKPGMTGWAQINGRASLPWSERIELDLWYVEHRSLGSI